MLKAAGMVDKIHNTKGDNKKGPISYLIDKVTEDTSKLQRPEVKAMLSTLVDSKAFLTELVNRTTPDDALDSKERAAFYNTARYQNTCQILLALNHVELKKAGDEGETLADLNWEPESLAATLGLKRHIPF